MKLRHTRKRILVALAVLGCVVLGQGAPAAAIELGEWVRGLRLTPFVSQKFEYESNVFQTPDDEQDDVIFTTIPGFIVEIARSELTLSLGYRAEILTFLDLSSQNTVHNIVALQGRLEYPRTLVSLRGDIIDTSEPPGTELTGRIDSLTLAAAPDVEYRLTQRFSVGANYAYKYVDYESGFDDLDRDEHLFGGSVFYRFRPTADINLNYGYGWLDFDSAPERDADRHLVTVGLRGDLTAKLSSTLRFGYESREGDLEDFQGFIMGGALTYRPGARTSIVLAVERSLQESVFAGNPFYVTTLGTLSVEHQFRPRLTGRVSAIVANNDYQVQETVDGVSDFRNDWIYGVGAGVDYEFRHWLRLGMQYNYEQRDSNFDAFDYDDHRVALTVTFRL